MKDAMFRRGNLSLTRQIGAERRGEVDDEDCQAHSEFLHRAADVSEKRTRDRVFVKECIDFLGHEDSGMFTRSERAQKGISARCAWISNTQVCLP